MIIIITTEGDFIVYRVCLDIFFNTKIKIKQNAGLETYKNAIKIHFIFTFRHSSINELPRRVSRLISCKSTFRNL